MGYCAPLPRWKHGLGSYTVQLSICESAFLTTSRGMLFNRPRQTQTRHLKKMHSLILLFVAWRERAKSNYVMRAMSALQ